MENNHSDNLDKIITSALFALSEQQFTDMLDGFIKDGRITKEEKDRHLLEYSKNEKYETDEIVDIIADAAIILSTEEFTDLLKEFEKMDLNDKDQKDSFINKFGLKDETNFI